jgi:hypothetical protein
MGQIDIVIPMNLWKWVSTNLLHLSWLMSASRDSQTLGAQTNNEISYVQTSHAQLPPNRADLPYGSIKLNHSKGISSHSKTFQVTTLRSGSSEKGRATHCGRWRVAGASLVGWSHTRREPRNRRAVAAWATRPKTQRPLVVERQDEEISCTFWVKDGEINMNINWT